MLVHETNNIKERSEKSFFDLKREAQIPWKQAEANELVSYPKRVEGEFFTRNSNSNQNWDSCYLLLQGNILVYKKKKSASQAEYIKLEEHFYKVSIVNPQDVTSSSKFKSGFKIYANGASMIFLCKDRAQLYKWLTYFREICVMSDLNDSFRILHVLGTGGYGEVKLLEDRSTRIKRAGKFIKLLEEEDPKASKQKIMIMNEIKIMQKLDHPNIVKMYEIYEHEDKVCIVMEYIEGQRLIDLISQMKTFGEKETASIMSQLLLALGYLESKDILHRDIKIENIMLAQNSSEQHTVKLIDFGLSTYFHDKDAIKKCGTPGYVAPEMLRGEPYDFRADLFSAGVVMFICLMGTPLFSAHDHKDLIERNRKGVVNFRGRRWSKLTNEARDLIQKIVEPISVNRSTLEEAIFHVWFQKYLSETEKNQLEKFSFQLQKMTVPEENEISMLPVNPGHSIKFLSTSNIGLQNKVFPHILVNSNTFGLDEDRYLALNSFYKIRHSKDSLVSRDESPDIQNLLQLKSKANSRSYTQTHLTSDRNYTKSPSIVMLGVPRVHSNQKLNESGNFLSATRSRSNSRQTFDTYNDDDYVPDENRVTCGEKYSKLTNIAFCFRKIERFQLAQPDESESQI